MRTYSTSRARRISASLALGVTASAILWTPGVEAYTYTQQYCNSGNQCITTTDYQTYSTYSGPATEMSGWNIASNDGGWYNLYNFAYSNGNSTNNRSHDSRNRNSVTQRTACYYSGNDTAGTSSSDAYSNSVYWRNIGIGTNVASSFKLVAAGAQC